MMNKGAGNRRGKTVEPRYLAAMLLACTVMSPAFARPLAAAGADDAGADTGAGDAGLGDAVNTRGATDIVVFAPADPDADRSAVGKPRVLTTTTTAQTLRDRMVDSIADYARRVDAGVNFNADSQSINIRGLDQNRVLTTIDGVRTPWLNDGARGVQGGEVSFDFNALSAIDVVKNSDSSFFGTGSLGGVLALRTLDPEDLLVNGKTMAGLSKLTYDSSSDSGYLNQAVAVRTGDTLFLVQGGYQNGHETENQGRIGGTGATRTRKDPAAYDQTNLLVKLRQYLPGGHRFGLAGEIFDRDYDEDTLSSVNATYSRYRTDEKNKRRRVSGTYDYQADGADGAIREAHLLVYWQKTDMITLTQSTRLTQPAGEYDRDSDLQERAFGATGSLTTAFTTGPFAHAVTIGGEAYVTRTSQYAAGQDNCTPAIYSCAFLHVNQSDMPRVHGVDLGAVVQDRIGMGAGDWLHVTPGFRFDWYRRNPRPTPSYAENAAYEGLPARSSDSHFSPKVLVEAQVVPRLTLYGQYSQAFRAPSATELYLTYGGTGTYVSIGNPDLKPETSRGWEIGARFGDKDRGIRVALYDNHYHNFIDTITTTAAAAGLSGSYPFGVFEYLNRQHVRIRGVEASGNWALSRQWRVWASLAYSDGKDTDAGVHLNSIPPLRSIVGVGYSHTDFGADLSATIAGSRRKVEDPTSDLNKTSGYGIVDFTGWWTPFFARALRLQAGVYNMFDKKYWNALDLSDSSTVAKDYYTQPGRTFKVTAILNF